MSQCWDWDGRCSCELTYFPVAAYNLGLGEMKITFEDLIPAFVRSLLCIISWRLIPKDAEPKKQHKSAA